MIEIAFVLLMYIDSNIDRYAYFNGSIGQCLSQKRQVERDYSRRYKNTRLECAQYRVEVEEIAGVKHITDLVEKIEASRDPRTRRLRGSSTR
jgi:hypothetical protein